MTTAIASATVAPYPGSVEKKAEGMSLYRQAERLWKAKEGKQALENYIKAGELGHPEGLFFIGFGYYTGELGYPRDEKKGYQIIAEAAQVGSTKAAIFINKVVEQEHLLSPGCTIVMELDDDANPVVNILKPDSQVIQPRSENDLYMQRISPSNQGAMPPQSYANPAMSPEVMALATQMAAQMTAQMMVAQGMAPQAAPPEANKLHLPEGMYTGQLLNGQPHGTGILIYSANNEDKRKKYEGEFQNGLPHGQGIMMWASGGRYDGEWANNRRDGIGTHHYPNGSSYEGGWKEDKCHGRGVWRRNGWVFEGEYVNDKREGQGVDNGPNGIKKVGAFKDDNFWEGTSYVPGSKFKRKYKNGKPDECCTIV